MACLDGQNSPATKPQAMQRATKEQQLVLIQVRLPKTEFPANVGSKVLKSAKSSPFDSFELPRWNTFMVCTYEGEMLKESLKPPRQSTQLPKKIWPTTVPKRWGPKMRPLTSRVLQLRAKGFHQKVLATHDPCNWRERHGQKFQKVDESLQNAHAATYSSNDAANNRCTGSRDAAPACIEKSKDGQARKI